jgi:hypothetical protein
LTALEAVDIALRLDAGVAVGGGHEHLALTVTLLGVPHQCGHEWGSLYLHRLSPFSQ